MMPLSYTLCSPEDLGRLTQLARHTFIDAFERHNNPDDFSAYLNAVLTEENLKKELQHPDSSFYFVKKGTTVAGYFKINENKAQTEFMGNAGLELERIYIASDFQGNKIGSRTLQEVIHLAKEMKKSFVWLGVWEHNVEAIRFYERHGFVKFGEHPYYVGKDRQIDWLMRLDLISLNT